MISWYVLDVVDTLLFKGAEPVARGENHFASSIFPPPVATISGAVRTLYLKQNGIRINDYIENRIDDKIVMDIGRAGEKPPFDILGPLFLKNGEIFAPAPYNWFEEVGGEFDRFSVRYKTKIIKSVLAESGLFKAKKKIYWVKRGKYDLKTLGGKWIRYRDLIRLHDLDDVEVFSPNYFFLEESRTGISLDLNRNVREGHLYSFNHVRLTKNTKLLFGVTKEISIHDKGVLKLGAEQRFVKYERTDNIEIEFGESGSEFLALAPQECREELMNLIIATGKIKYIGGWDLKKGFHKPVVGYYPAGTVFSKKASSNLIKIN